MIVLNELEKTIIKELEDKYPVEKIKGIFSKYDFEDMFEAPSKPAKLLIKRLRPPCR